MMTNGSSGVVISAMQPAADWTFDETTCQWIDPNPPSYATE